MIITRKTESIHGRAARSFACCWKGDDCEAEPIVMLYVGDYFTGYASCADHADQVEAYALNDNELRREVEPDAAEFVVERLRDHIAVLKSDADDPYLMGVLAALEDVLDDRYPGNDRQGSDAS